MGTQIKQDEDMKVEEKTEVGAAREAPAPGRAVPDRARSEEDVGVDVEVPLLSAWLLWSESGVEESAELSTEEELEGGGAVTVEDDPEEDEEVDLGIAAGTGGEGASGAALTPVAPAEGWLESWLDPPAGAGPAGGAPSGRTAVPETHI